jgi:hypothetical protein
VCFYVLNFLCAVVWAVRSRSAPWFPPKWLKPGVIDVYLGIATHGTDRQTGHNTSIMVRAMEEGRGLSVSKNVNVCTDGAANMSSDAVGAAQDLVEWSDGAVKGLHLLCVFVCDYSD